MVMVILGNCAPRVALGPAYIIYPEIRSIEIELRSYSFQPNHIVILKNKPCTLSVRLINTAEIKHNFTSIDDQKNILSMVNLMPKETTFITIKSFDLGNYIFYCNRFLHRFWGMKGMLMVE